VAESILKLGDADDRTGSFDLSSKDTGTAAVQLSASTNHSPCCHNMKLLLSGNTL